MISSKILYEINQKMKNFADTYVLQLYGRSGYFTNEWGKETYVRFYSNDDQRSVLERMYPNNKKMVEKRLTSYDEFWKGCFPGGISILVDSEKVFKDVKANGFIDGVVL